MFLGHSDKEIVTVQDRNGQGYNSRAETYSVCYVDTGMACLPASVSTLSSLVKF